MCFPKSVSLILRKTGLAPEEPHVLAIRRVRRGPLSVLSVCFARVYEDSFTGLADARAALLCASVIFLSTCCLRASNQGVLSFKSGYSLQDEILKILE